MKTKIILLISAVALVTLSFTFAGIQAPSQKAVEKANLTSNSEPVGGFMGDEVTR